MPISQTWKLGHVKAFILNWVAVNISESKDRNDSYIYIYIFSVCESSALSVGGFFLLCERSLTAFSLSFLSSICHLRVDDWDFSFYFLLSFHTFFPFYSPSSSNSALPYFHRQPTHQSFSTIFFPLPSPKIRS